MPKFNRDEFLAATNDNNEFDDIPSGTYELELTHTGFKEFDSGSENVSFGWQLTDENENYAGQMVWWNQNVTKKNGEQNDIGVQQLCSWCMKMSNGRFNVDAFLDDPETELERLHGTIVLASVKKTEKDGYVNYEFRHRRTRKVVYDNPQGSEQTSNEVDMSENLVEERELRIGDDVAFKKAGGIAVGKCVSFVGNNQEGYVEVAIKGHENMNIPVADVVAIAEDCSVYKEGLFNKEEPASSPVEAVETLEDEDDVLDEEPTQHAPKLEKGQKVTYQWEGKSLSGSIYDINEDEGTLRVVVIREDGKKVARKLNISDVVPS